MGLFDVFKKDDKKVETKVEEKKEATKTPAELYAEAQKKAKEEAEKIATAAKSVMEGKYGELQEDIEKKLRIAGYDVEKVMAQVKALKGNVEEIAKEVIQGKWGNGDERKAKLKAAGFDPAEVQALVNKLLG